MSPTLAHNRILAVLILLLLLIAALLCSVLFFGTAAPPAQSSAQAVEYLAAAPSQPARSGFRLQDVPPWLFAHVAAIAAAQVLALLFALRLARRGRLSRAEERTVQFLCEVPMYLGLFGTLLGVCLTQFLTGSLVAPLAYLTTMSGILLHLLGKLSIWLPLCGEAEPEA